MQIVCKYIKNIILKNDDGEIEMMYQDFDEYIDSITIRTDAINPDPNLKRGWVGDLTVVSDNGINISDGEEVDERFSQTYKDVLLRNIKVRSDMESAVGLEYLFLKY